MAGVQEYIDANSAVIGLIILAVMFVEFLRERYPVSVVSLLGACAFLATGLLDADGLFSAFSNSAPIAIGAMLILSGALMLRWLGKTKQDPAATGAAESVETAVARVLSEPSNRTVDLGGKLSTTEMTARVLEALA